MTGVEGGAPNSDTGIEGVDQILIADPPNACQCVPVSW